MTKQLSTYDKQFQPFKVNCLTSFLYYVSETSMDMTLIAFCILFVCKVSVGLKGRRETMRRTSRRTFKLEQRPERRWAISWLPDLQVRAHDKAQLRCVPASVFSFPFSCFASGVGKRTQPENNRPYLFCCFVTSLKSHDCLLQNSPFQN